MTQSRFSKGLTVLLIAFLAVGMVGPAVAQNAAINYDSGAAPQTEVAGEVTIADHPMGEAPLTYNNDNGEWVTLAGHVNDSVDNPFTFSASAINFSDASAFPHAKPDVSWTESGEWTTTVSDTTNTALTVSAVETAPGVDAINIATGGSMGSGDTATATMANFSITSDEEKRYLQLVGNVNSIDAGATVDVRVIDADGDYYNATIDPGASGISDTVIANQTGDGFVFQQQIGTMTMTQVGDGTFNDIEKVEVVTADADADVTFSAVNVDKMGAWDFGDKKVNTDADDALETTQIIDHNTGAISVHDLGTMGDTFQDANIKGLTVPFVTPVSALDSADVNATFTDAPQYANYESHFLFDVRFELPDAYDLSYANLELRDTVSVPGTRYVSVEYAEGTGDTAFGDISSYSAITANYDSAGASVSIDSTVQPGSAMVISYDYVITGSEKSELRNTGGAAMGPTGSSEGFLGSIWAKLLAVVGSVGIIGKWRNWWL